MSAPITSDRIVEPSPRTRARITGAFYLAMILAGVFAQGFVSNRLLVFNDAAATAGPTWK
jgi:hypothetical protein